LKDPDRCRKGLEKHNTGSPDIQAEVPFECSAFSVQEKKEHCQLQTVHVASTATDTFLSRSNVAIGTAWLNPER
jgi:hypothetical protein